MTCIEEFANVVKILSDWENKLNRRSTLFFGYKSVVDKSVTNQLKGKCRGVAQCSEIKVAYTGGVAQACTYLVNKF